MNNTVSYSLLKYTHSRLLGEELNVGILFVFYEERRVEFVFPHSLSRLKKTYPNASADLIKSYLVSFKKRAESLGRNINEYSGDFDELISKELLITDGSSLQFTRFNHALITEDIESTKEYYEELYLGSYNVAKPSVHKSDKSIVTECKKIILSKRPEIAKELIADQYFISHNKVIFKPDLRWQNHTLNLIKGVSFDLADEQGITNKALLIQNQLSHVGTEIRSNNIRIDLLVSRPQKAEFLDAYNYALEILNETNTNKEIVEEENIEQYADKVTTEIEF